MSGPPKRKFTGFYMPVEILKCKDLNPSEKLLLAEIRALDNENGCWAGNKHLGEAIGCEAKTVANMLTRLRKRKFIHGKDFDGKRRCIHVNSRFCQSKKGDSGSGEDAGDEGKPLPGSGKGGPARDLPGSGNSDGRSVPGSGSKDNKKRKVKGFAADAACSFSSLKDDAHLRGSNGSAVHAEQKNDVPDDVCPPRVGEPDENDSMNPDNQPVSNGRAVRRPKKATQPTQSSAPIVRPERQAVMDIWTDEYRIHKQRPYSGTLDKKHLEAIDQLLATGTPEELRPWIKKAFLLQGRKEAWACNNRMANLPVAVKNWSTITDEIDKHRPNENAWIRAELGQRKQYWHQSHQAALLSLKANVGTAAPSNEAVLAFLGSDEAAQSMGPFLCCVLSGNAPEILSVHGEAARALLAMEQAEGVDDFLKSMGLELDENEIEKLEARKKAMTIPEVQPLEDGGPVEAVTASDY